MRLRRHRLKTPWMRVSPKLLENSALQARRFLVDSRVSVEWDFRCAELLRQWCSEIVMTLIGLSDWVDLACCSLEALSYVNHQLSSSKLAGKRSCLASCKQSLKQVIIRG